jgi:hypothetical protein
MPSVAAFQKARAKLVASAEEAERKASEAAAAAKQARLDDQRWSAAARLHRARSLKLGGTPSPSPRRSRKRSRGGSTLSGGSSSGSANPAAAPAAAEGAAADPTAPASEAAPARKERCPAGVCRACWAKRNDRPQKAKHDKTLLCNAR